MPPATDVSGARRILVYGVTGSGKTRAAQAVAARTGLPLVLVDELTWQPGWVPVELAAQRELFGKLVAADRWILDTAYGAWLDVVLPRVDLVIGLDYPRWFSLQRLIRRSLARLIDRRPICNGNTETLRGLVGRESIIRWHFQSFPRKRARMRQWAEAPEGPAVVIVRRPAQLEHWIGRFDHPAVPGEAAPGPH